MPTLANVVLHPVTTARSGYQYQFTPKHHGADKNAAQWLPAVTLDEEFAVFNTADVNNLADDDGNLYGVEKIGDDDLRVLGTRGEQVAKFPATATPAIYMVGGKEFVVIACGGGKNPKAPSGGVYVAFALN